MRNVITRGAGAVAVALTVALGTGCGFIPHSDGLPGNVPVDEQSGTIDLTGFGQDEAVQMLTQQLNDASGVHTIQVNPEGWTPESLVALHEACPTAVLQGTYLVGSVQVPLDAAQLDLTTASANDIVAVSQIVPCMVNLKTINVGREDGHTKLPAVKQLVLASPNVTTNYDFTAFGLLISVNETRLDFRQVPMDDQGEEVRDLLTNMPYVTSLDMDRTGVDDEHMAAIRDDFPNVDVVWRVWFGPNDVYTVRTDVEKILASAEVYGWLSPENDQSLKYCTKCKYLDLGHNGTLEDISFVSYMPDLEVFICILGNITDISPLADCPHLEFLEIFSNYVTDLSPLANCKELKHLNASNNPGISDITCLYDIDLERLWFGQYNSVPQEQFDTYQELHPNCTVRTVMSNPHEDYRWGNPRYELLRQQMGYGDVDSDYQTAANDPLYETRTDFPWADPARAAASVANADGDDDGLATDGSDDELTY